MHEIPSTDEQLFTSSHTHEAGSVIGTTALLEIQRTTEGYSSEDEARKLTEFQGRSPEWITDGIDEGKLKQLRLGQGNRFYHVDLSDNPIETDFPLGNLVNIVQVGKRDAYVWRLASDDENAQYLITDDSFHLGEDGSYEGWWTPLESGQDISLSDKVGDDSEGNLDLALREYKGTYELGVRFRGSNVQARVIRAESSDEIQEKLQEKQQKEVQQKQAEEFKRHREWLESQKFDNFVNFASYDSFLETSVEHYLKTPERTRGEDPGVKYTEIHLNDDGETYIVPAPRGMRPYGATLSGHHSIVDELRAYEGYEEFPNYMNFVNGLHIDTDTIKSKGYIKIDDEGNLILELNQNRGNPAERGDFKWLKDATEAAKKAGIKKVVLDDFYSKELLEIDLDAETETQIQYSPEYEPFNSSDVKSPTMTVGVLEAIELEDAKILKVGHQTNAKVKSIKKINLEGSEADIKLHEPLHERVERRHEGFKDTKYPISLEIGGNQINLAVTYQYDRQDGEFGVSFRFESSPPDELIELQDAIIRKLVDSFALQSKETKNITGSVSVSVGDSGLPNSTPIDVHNPYFRK